MTNSSSSNTLFSGYINSVINIDALRTYDISNLTTGAGILVTGNEYLGDHSGGAYFLDLNSTANDDGLTVVAPNSGSGRWLLGVGRGNVGPAGPAGANGANGPAGPAGPAGGLASVSSFGSLATPSAALATTQSALNAQGEGGTIVVDSEALLGTGEPTNPAVSLIGDKKLYTTPTGTGSLNISGGRKVFNKVGRSDALYNWGTEYLGPVFLKKLAAGSPIQIALIGDSNTAGNAGPLIASLLGSLPNCTVTNYGVSGTTFEQWRIGAGGGDWTGKSMASVMAAAPDLLIDCYGGTNDPAFAGSPAAFESSKRTAYTAVRAQYNVQQMSIVMVTSGPQNNGAPNTGTTSLRDELWNAEVRPIIKQLAQDYQAAFVDKNARVPDAFVDFLAQGSQDSNLDTNRVHTQPWLSAAIAQWVFEGIVPSNFRSGASSFMFGGGSPIAAGLTPANFPLGFSIAAVAGLSEYNSMSWVATFSPVSGAGKFPLQVAFSYAGGLDGTGSLPLIWRTTFTGNTTWGPWQNLGGGSLGVTPASGFTAPGTQAMKTKLNGGEARGSGYFTITTPAALTKGQAIGQIGLASHRPIVPMYGVRLIALVNQTGYEVLSGNITTGGAITCQQAGTLSASQVWIDHTWPVI
jgi:hypothetical protein